MLTKEISVPKTESPREQGPKAEQEPSANNTSPRVNINEILITFFTAVLAVVAALQFLAMRKQAEYMRKGLMISIRAARASRRAAEAAKENVELIISQERARVRVDAQDFDIRGIDITGIPPEYVKEQRFCMHAVPFTVSCYAPTPAFIVSSKAAARFLASKEPLID